MRIQLLIATLFFSFCLQGQSLPKTNLMLFDFSQKSDSVFELKNPKFLTDFNKEGYNNQPYFMSNNELYLTVQMSTDTSQTDIYSLNLDQKKLTRVTATVESEYSPTFIPPVGRPQNYDFSVVRVEADEKQRLWRLPMNRRGKGKPVFENITNIGYHYWVDYRDVVLFAVADPYKMMVADSRDESARFVTSNIGRCFQAMNDGTIAYVEKVSDASWLLKKVDTRTLRTSLITATLSNSEDFATLRDGSIIMANGTKLYKFNQRKDIGWVKIADLSYYGMNNISRIAVNRAQDKIVIVID